MLHGPEYYLPQLWQAVIEFIEVVCWCGAAVILYRSVSSLLFHRRMATCSPPRVAFVSGHTDLTDDEFDEHYRAQLECVVENKHCVVVGNADGADARSLRYLLAAGHDPSLITVYVFDRGGENRVAHYQQQFGVAAIGGWPSYNKRDAAMTAASDYDLCWVRPEAECRRLYGDSYRKRVSGTEQNVLRRQKMASKTQC